MIKAKKIVIDENGLLSVQREHHSKPHMMVCPFRHGHHYCGEWCPHFPDVTSGEKYETGEPEFNLDLECGDFTAITAPEFTRMNGPEEPKPDHRDEFKKNMDAAHRGEQVVTPSENCRTCKHHIEFRRNIFICEHFKDHKPCKYEPKEEA